ncbi:hypothetical protein FSARC_10834 [Fusarium sarcochroum]|uniref:Right handed beta helix domain-containing protein n=1 Tax=Fusarium sarcochroum TaxID=1208366 RepID=A0A8H4TJN1_9HYPO|nr:hypothetical protein FSARC_10834 [Fusarium sarcochroum]
MKFSLTLAGLLGLASASPFTEHDTSNGLMPRHGKCNWKDKHCCTYPDQYKDTPKGPTEKKYYGYGRTVYVKSGKKIQHALDKASPGDRIIVEAGDYKEQLVIKTDGIHLEGRPGAKIIKPDNYKNNACTGLTQDAEKKDAQVGICITGYKVKTTKFIAEHKRVTSVERAIKGVSVSGFEVSGFNGINIAIIGAKNTHITKNKLVDGGAYSALTLGSVNTVFAENIVTTTAGGVIGICMDNKSDVLVKNNDVSAHFIGLCVQTDGAVLEYNTLHDNCIGIFVDPGVKGAKIAHNEISKAPAVCPIASGITLGSAIATLVRDNKITGQRLPNKSGTGIKIYDDDCKPTPESGLSLRCIVLGHAVKATDNVVIRNILSDNDNDIVVESKGKGNVVKCNTCENPANLKAGQCKKS